MPTLLQEKLAEAIVANTKLPPRKRKNKRDLIVSVGYDETTARAAPGRTLEQKGVQEALEKYGLTKELVTTALVEDIKAKPQKRLGELNLSAEILGMKEHEGGGNKTLILVVSGETNKRYGLQADK